MPVTVTPRRGAAHAVARATLLRTAWSYHGGVWARARSHDQRHLANGGYRVTRRQPCRVISAPVPYAAVRFVRAATRSFRCGALACRLLNAGSRLIAWPWG